MEILLEISFIVVLAGNQEISFHQSRILVNQSKSLYVKEKINNNNCKQPGTIHVNIMKKENKDCEVGVLCTVSPGENCYLKVSDDFVSVNLHHLKIYIYTRKS